MVVAYKNHSPKIPESCYIFPTATIIGDVTLGENVIVYPGCVIRGECGKVEIGDNTNIQENSTIHGEIGFDVKIGSGVTIGHNSVIHGCTIEDDVLIGMGSILQDSVLVQAQSFVGAGALLKRNFVVPPAHTAYGFPAKVIRPINAEERGDIALSTQEYMAYLAEMKRQTQGKS